MVEEIVVTLLLTMVIVVMTLLENGASLHDIRTEEGQADGHYYAPAQVCEMSVYERITMVTMMPSAPYVDYING